MAKTDGRGNPPWTRDETILALNLFLESGLVALPDTDPRVLELSETLRSLPGNEQRSANQSFRNPAGVAFKLSNLQSVATGRGFANVSATDRAVWKHFENRRQRIKDVAITILSNVAAAPLNSGVDQDDVEFAEGSVVTRMHKRIERNRNLRRKLITDRRNRNTLRCDACFKTNPTTDPHLDEAIFDVHHLAPLSSLGKSTTRLTDVALLCANCHRLIHRIIATSGKWATVDDVRKAIDH